MNHSNHPSLTLRELATLVGAATARTLPQATLHRLSALDDSDAHCIVFAQDDAALANALQSRAGAILAKTDAQPNGAATADPRVLRVRDPRYAMALAAKALAAAPEDKPIHPSAIIHPSAELGVGVRVGAGAVIEADTIIGEGSIIAARATICRGVRLGSRVVVQSGAVLGSVGFGYARNRETGEYLLFPQQGTLVIEDDVEIGANSTIDRGALGETRIGKGTKIDNLVHIGHNCRIGKNVIIAAQVGLSGSCTVDDGAILAGQVGLGDHVHIGPGVVLGGQGGVFTGATVEGPGQVFAGTPAEPLKNYLKSLARLRRLK
jgi:UDP-3-O-[3-hydroxymyristoyl] glucosamine N-acyltransferase